MHFSKLLSSALLSVTLLGGLVSVAQAATFTVTKTADTDDGACDVDCSLREAITAAKTQDGADTIEFAAELFSTPQTISLEGSELTLDSDLTINGPPRAILTLDGHNQYRVFHATAGHIFLNHLVIANGTSFNSIHSDGGGCVLLQNATLDLNRCVIKGGVSAFGGGILTLASFLKMTNCTLTDNLAIFPEPDFSSAGGALNNGNYSTATLVNCTLTKNRAVGSRPHTGGGYGGGIGNSGATLYLLNCIVAGNEANGDGDSNEDGPDIYANFNSLGHNLIGVTGSQNVSKGYVATDLLNVDPKFELDGDGHSLLKDNGGFTYTVGLQPGSPAIDSGYSNVLLDQRGVPRPSKATDIGALEVNSVPVIESVTLLPSEPTAGHGLYVSVKVVDANSPYPHISYSWTRTRGGQTVLFPDPYNELSDPTSQPGDVFTVTVVASDGFAQSAPVSASVTVVNAPISITSIKLQPSQPYTFDQLFVTVQTADLDKTRPFFSYTWTKNGEVVKTVTGSRIGQNFFDLKATGHGDKGDVIEVTVTVTDDPIAETATTATAKANATIRNSVPVLSLLTLTPEAPTPQNVITSNFGGRDADGDKLTKLYIWKIGKKVLPEEKSARLNLAKYPFVKVGDVVSLEMRLSDGEALSRTRIAQVTVVAPTSPATVSAPLTSSEASGNAS